LLKSNDAKEQQEFYTEHIGASQADVYRRKRRLSVRRPG